MGSTTDTVEIHAKRNFKATAHGTWQGHLSWISVRGLWGPEIQKIYLSMKIVTAMKRCRWETIRPTAVFLRNRYAHVKAYQRLKFQFWNIQYGRTVHHKISTHSQSQSKCSCISLRRKCRWSTNRPYRRMTFTGGVHKPHWVTYKPRNWERQTFIFA